MALPSPGSTEEALVFQANHGDGTHGVVARDLAHYFAMLPSIMAGEAHDRY